MNSRNVIVPSPSQSSSFQRSLDIMETAEGSVKTPCRASNCRKTSSLDNGRVFAEEQISADYVVECRLQGLRFPYILSPPPRPLRNPRSPPGVPALPRQT